MGVISEVRSFGRSCSAAEWPIPNAATPIAEELRLKHSTKTTASTADLIPLGDTRR